VDPSASTSTIANGINSSGQIAGSYQTGGVDYGFVLSGGVYTTLDFPGSTYTDADGINIAGQMVRFYRDSSDVEHGFLATPAPEPETLVSTMSFFLLMTVWNCRRLLRAY
jgi:hypothetical protein